MVDHTFEIEIQIVDHCNLNCDNCNHFANLATPWYMSKEEFEFSLKRIREEFFPYGLKRLMILGGEPLLHPNFKELCFLARKIFPEKDFDISILTNGIKLISFSEEELKYYSEKIHFSVTPYPNINYPEHVKQFILRENMSKLPSRLFFITTNIDQTPVNSANYNFLHCPKYKIPCFFVKNYKLYICPFSGCIHILKEKFNLNIECVEGDYIDLHTCTFKDLLHLKEQGPKQICSYCNSRCMPVYWSNGSKIELNNYLGLNDKELFLNNYPLYDKLINGCDILNKFKTENYLQNNVKLIDLIDNEYCTEKTKKELSRVKGKIDIIIPFYNITKELATNLHNTLSTQTIINDCHIYLISDNSPQEECVFDIFSKSNLNITFLKTSKRSGPGVARQIGIDNSFNPYLFFLDSDDEFIDDKGLEKMFDLMDVDVDIVSGITQRIDCGFRQSSIESEYFMWNPGSDTSQDSHCLLYNRAFLKKHNISYNSTYIAEDADFMHQVVYYQPNIMYIKNPIYLYKRNLPTSIGVETSLFDKLFSRIIINFKNSNYKDLNERWYDILFADDITSRYNEISRKELEEIIGITFYMGLIFYNKLSEDEKKLLYVPEKDHFTYLLQQKIFNQDLELNIFNKIYKTEKDYKFLILEKINSSVIKENLMKELEKWI